MPPENDPLPLEPLVAGIPVTELLTSLPDGVGVMVDGLIGYYNEAVAGMLGHARDDLLGHSPAEFLHPEDRDRAVERMRRVMEGGVDEPAQYRLRHADGHWVPVEIWSRAVELEGRRAMLSVFRDLTEREEREQERQLLATAVEQAAEVIVITDLQGTINYVNPAFERITGYERQEVVGENPRVLNSGIQSAGFYRDFWKTLTSGRVWRGRMTNRRKDGSLYIQETTVSPVRDARGRTTHFVGVGRDVTALVELEEQLRESQKMEALGQITAGVAHDFNNLLTVIGANAELIRQGLSEDEAELLSYLGDLRQSAKSGASLVRQLMTFTRKRPLSIASVSVPTLIQGLGPVLRRFLPTSIEIEAEIPEELPTIQADAGAVEQMLINLATNARDAMSEGGTILLKARAVELAAESVGQNHWGPPGEYVEISVTDTGIGMDETLLLRAFEPLFTTKEPGSGTGLGLAVVYGLMRSHSGGIHISSEEGEGTTVTLLFPTAPDPGRVAGAAEETSEGLPGGSEYLLVVDDDVGLQRAAKKILERLGYRVHLAGDGVEALAALAEQDGTVDLVISDVVMPRMGGIELLARARQEHPDTPFLLMSGYNRMERVGGSLDPSTPYLQKPWTVAGLARAVRSALDEPA